MGYSGKHHVHGCHRGPVGCVAGRTRPGRSSRRSGLGRRLGGPPGSHPWGLRDQRRHAPRQVAPTSAPAGRGGDPGALARRGRDRARRGRGAGIPERLPRSRVLPSGARADPPRGRPVRHERGGARTARHGGVRQRQPHGTADARPRPSGHPRGLRGEAFPGNGLRHHPRVLLQQRGAPDARARGVGPRPVPGAPRAAVDVPRGRLSGRLHPGDRGRSPRQTRGLADGRRTRLRLSPGGGGRHLRRHPADARAARHSLRCLLERGAALHRRESRRHPRGAPRGGVRLRQGRGGLAPFLGDRPAAGPRAGEVDR